MWHEARKQEKFIRNVMVDVKKRAERRKDFYEKIKLDPIRFLRLYGTKSKINIDPEIAIAAENPNTLMAWTGDNTTIIDRFDGRANLDSFSTKSQYSSCDRDEKLHERMCNYERYRCLVHNQFAKINEINALNRIELAEKFGEDIHKIEKRQTKKRLHKNGYITVDKLNKHIFFEQFEEAPYLHAVITYFCYIILNLIGRMRDFLRRWNFEKNHAATAPPKTSNFVPLYQDYEAFYNRNLYRRVRDCWNRPICSVPGATIDLVDRVSEDNNWTFKHLNTTSNVINFGSYNYLGFAQNKGFCADAVETAISKYGIGLGSPRQECGNHILHTELEQLVANFTGQEASIVFPMGFATNSLNLPILVDKHCCVISDELNHTSLILGIRLSGAQIRRFKHNNISNLEKQLREAVVSGHPRTRRPFKKILVVVEGIYSMEGSIVRLPQILELKKKYKFFVYLDEAHSIGALGPHGKGVIDYFNVDPKEIDVAMGTFTKSFGSAGGYIAGNKRLIDFIREKSHSSIYGAAMSAPICQQIIASIKVIEGIEGGNQGISKISQLAWNVQYFRAALHKKGYVVFGNKDSPVVPIIIYTPTKLAAFSRECLIRGIGTVVVGFPATSIILARARFCISASHTKEMIDQTLRVIDEVSDMININYSRLPVPDWCDKLPDQPNLLKN